jgi:hypothetical protein
MNPFIDPKKRGVSLPKGCKDLIDTLRRRKGPAADAVSKRLLAEYTERLKSSGLSPAARARIERTLEEITEQMKRAT